MNLFAMPEPLPVYESNDGGFVYEPNFENTQKKTGEIELKSVMFYSDIKKFRAVIELKSFDDEKENITLHFFTKNKKTARYLLSQKFRTSVVISNGNAYTNLTEIETLSKLKSLQNIFAIAEFERDYQENTIPVFNSEVAVPISTYKGKN